jgi:hypothetical protein
MIGKKIYLVAGERNCSKGAIKENGGLYANIGETIRSVLERTRDEDYRRKQLGGKITILKEWEITQYSFSDRDIHKQLKMHPRVKWESSDNTEEFLFLDDKGDGSVATEIIENIIIGLLCPSFVVDIICRLKQVADFSHDEERQKLVDEREQLELDKLSHKEYQADRIRNLLLVKKDKEEEITLLTKRIKDRNRRIEQLEKNETWRLTRIDEAQTRIHEAELSLSKKQSAFSLLSFATIAIIIIFYFMYSNQSSLISEKTKEIESLNTLLIDKEKVIKSQLDAINDYSIKTDKYYSEFVRCVMNPKSITEKDRENAKFYTMISNGEL